MSSNNSNSYINKIVSLISTANIRYEGTIYKIDNDTITLKNVRIFGTEDRECTVFIGMLQEMKPMISFTKTGIRSINLIPTYTFYDPSIVSTSKEDNSSLYSSDSTHQVHSLQKERNNNDVHFKKGMSQHDILRNLPSNDEMPISNNFDFEESNKLFDKDLDNADSIAPAYNKSDFFDSLQSNRQDGMIFHDRNYRQTDLETFGKSSLEERNREYYQRNNRYRYNNRYQNGGYNHRGSYNQHYRGYNQNRGSHFRNEINKDFDFLLSPNSSDYI